ncbi:MAG: methyltransferase domain-containing protein [Desulfobacula sp.]|jgi:predicted O-methyltransferase YrrM|nr:methyltransferase domain-containing protein [Desulfobacula sp.]
MKYPITYEKMAVNHTMISNEHLLYTENVSANAASLPCCLYLLALCDMLRPNRILDLGSGISSYCLRLYKKYKDPEVEIHSIDADEAWLQTSKQYCATRVLDTTHFWNWDDFKGTQGRFDLIFLDIDMSPKRKLYFQPVFDQFAVEGSFILLDDMHKSIIGRPFDKLMDKAYHQEYNIKALTLDQYGRFSRLIKFKGGAQ